MDNCNFCHKNNFIKTKLSCKHNICIKCLLLLEEPICTLCKKNLTHELPENLLHIIQNNLRTKLML